MQSINQRLPQKAYRIIKVAPTTTTRRMSLFPHAMFTSDFPRFQSGEFTPLFRLLDDYASHQFSRSGACGNESGLAGGLASFKPKFDVKENKDNYELHGELPGIEQKDVQIEFRDASTLVIKGRTERHTESGTRPAGLIDAAPEQPKPAASTSGSEHYHAPSVEDDTPTTTTSGGGSETPSASTTSTELAKTDGTAPEQQQQQQQQQQQPPKEKSHWWVSERSVGEFHRSFSFPARVDHDNVTASLKNGILSIVVPKSHAPTTRRINIE